MILALAFSFVFLLGMLMIIGWDLARYQIPNWLVISLAAGFVPYAVFAGLDVTAIAWHVGAGVVILLIGLVLYLLKWFGGGDGKALAAAALWLGAGQEITSFLVLTALLGGVIAILLILFRRLKVADKLSDRPWLARLHDREGGVPYGVAIGLAGLIMFPQLPGLPLW